jgi:hypothetical protein
VNTTLDEVRRWAWGRKIPVHTTGYPPRAVIEAFNRVHPHKPLSLPRGFRLPEYKHKKEHA